MEDEYTLFVWKDNCSRFEKSKEFKIHEVDIERRIVYLAKK